MLTAEKPRPPPARRELPLDRDWDFRRSSDDPWQRIELPHTPFIADLDGRDHWFGLCTYRRWLHVPDAPALVAAGAQLALHIGAAMHTARVLVDECELAVHRGGYLPFEVDLTAALADGAPHLLALVLDNRDDPDVPPGKPFAELDYCWHGGLYRDAALRVYPPVHLTDPVAAGEVAGGGLLIRTLEASPDRAHVSVQAHVRNTSASARECAVEVEIVFAGDVAARGRSAALALAPGAATHSTVELTLDQPHLWSLDAPHLHHARVTVRDAAGGTALDARTERFGVRRLAFSRSRGLELNGRRIRPRGTNRHQEFPRVGYAAPAATQRRDARRLKEAGFDYVRLAHYPQSPAFMEACDELGILVMACIPGWQFLGGEAFREACFQNARDLIRRDRNHPCVALWELSLNETAMDEAFTARLHAIGHEELPGDQMFTCGWVDRYDVFIHSRQHGELHRWQNGEKALVVAEYGDWEFYASNHGFDQTTGAGVFEAWSHGRQRRAAGERGLRQQAENHVLALNDTLASPAVCDGQWALFDYARGYDPHRAACGLADVFRLPKFSWWFYRSQRDAGEDGGVAWTGGPVVFIASHWTPASALRVLVFSNAEEVELRLDGAFVGRARPAFTWMTQHLPHPPFVFDLPRFTPGTLEAVAFIGGAPVATHRVSTPGAPARLALALDLAGVEPAAGEPDVFCAHASLLDAHGTLCIGATDAVSFSVEGDVVLLGPAVVEAEAGIASVMLRRPAGGGAFVLRAQAACGAADVRG